MEIDLSRVKKSLSEIAESVKKIKMFTAVSDEEFWSDEKNILAIERLLTIAIEAMGAICLHVLAKKFGKSADAPAQCIDVFEEKGLFSPVLCSKIRKIFRFRNILIHRYWEAEKEKIYKYCKENLVDFEEFILTIGKIINL